jgi:Zn-dependent alcohol dehydrogenase
MRKRAIWLCLFILGTSSLTGCESMSNTAKGGLVGGGIGSGIGAIAGSATGKTGTGAAVGGLLGAAVGGLVGNDVDQEEKRNKDIQLAEANERAKEASAQPQLGLTDVQRMAAQQIDDEIIIKQISSTNSVYNLSAADIEWLKQNGVSNRVIMAMQDSRKRAAAHVAPPTRVIHERPVIIRQQPTVIYEPVPVMPAPPAFGFSYTRIR